MSPLSPGKNGDFSKTDILQDGHCVGWTADIFYEHYFLQLPEDGKQGKEIKIKLKEKFDIGLPTDGIVCVAVALR